MVLNLDSIMNLHMILLGYRFMYPYASTLTLLFGSQPASQPAKG